MKKNIMSSAALTFGITSIVLGLMCGMGTIFGGLGITFACLSRIDKMDNKALVGLVTSIMGLAVSIVLVVSSFILVYTTPELQDMMEEYYGDSFDSLFPTDEVTDDFYQNFENFFQNGGDQS